MAEDPKQRIDWAKGHQPVADSAAPEMREPEMRDEISPPPNSTEATKNGQSSRCSREFFEFLSSSESDQIRKKPALS